jgi:hypothetical protein
LQALVAAGLQIVVAMVMGQMPAGEQLVDVEGVGAAGVGDAQPSVERRANAAAIRVVSGKRDLPAMYISSEGSSLRVTSTGKVLESLRPNSRPFWSGQSQQAMEHGHRVGVLQILVEVVLVKDDVVVAHGVQHGTGGLVAQNGGVALDEGVQVLFLDEVGGDALDLVRRAAVERGDGDAAGDAGRDGVDEGALAGEELACSTRMHSWKMGVAEASSCR